MCLVGNSSITNIDTGPTKPAITPSASKRGGGIAYEEETKAETISPSLADRSKQPASTAQVGCSSRSLSHIPVVTATSTAPFLAKSHNNDSNICDAYSSRGHCRAVKSGSLGTFDPTSFLTSKGCYQEEQTPPNMPNRFQESLEELCLRNNEVVCSSARRQQNSNVGAFSNCSCSCSCNSNDNLSSKPTAAEKTVITDVLKSSNEIIATHHSPNDHLSADADDLVLNNVEESGDFVDRRAFQIAVEKVRSRICSKNN
jgi:hypothetical protein